MVITKARIVQAGFCLVLALTVGGSSTNELEYAFLQTACESPNGTFSSQNNGQHHQHDWTTSLQLRNRNSSICLHSMGIEALPATLLQDEPLLTSQATSDQLLSAIAQEGSGISFAVWIQQPTTIAERPRSLLSVGKAWQDPPSSGLESLTPCDTHDIDLHIVQHVDYLDVFFRSSDKVFEPCHRLRVHEFIETGSGGGMAHIALSLEDGLQQVFVNGERAAHSFEDFSNELSHWGGSHHVLSLLSYPNFAAWTTTLYQLNIVPGGLSADLVISRLVQGLLPSPPFAITKSVTIHEDAEKIPGSHAAEWYARDHSKQSFHSVSVLRREFDVIQLSARSLHSEVLELQKKLNLVSSNATTILHKYITRLPAHGSLYSTNGDRLWGENEMHELLEDQVVYIPPHNANSDEGHDGTLLPFSSFDFCASIEPILEKSQCTSTTVDIFVEPVNDPPVPINFHNKPVRIYEGQKSPSILVSGHDVDRNDSIARVQIVSSPTYGNLALNVGTFRDDGLPHGTHLSDINNLVTGPEDVYLDYEWDSQKSKGSLQPLLRDHFSFRVADMRGRWSREETVHFEIRSALHLDDNQTSTPIEVALGATERIHFSINVNDASGLHRRLGYFIDVAPPSRLGVLINPGTGRHLINGTLLETKDPGSLPSAEFQPSKEFCQFSREPDRIVMFEGRAVAFGDQEGRIVSVSTRARHHLRLRCLPSNLTWVLSQPRETVRVLQSSTRTLVDGACNSSSVGDGTTKTMPCSRTAILQGIGLESETPLDWVRGRIQVRIKAQIGYLTFNNESWNETMPLKGRRVATKGEVAFLARPADVESILKNLQYRSIESGFESIELTLFQGDKCFESSATVTNRTQFNMSTEHCHFSRANLSILVDLDKDSNRFDTALISGLPWQILICLLGYPIAYYILVRVEILFQKARERRNHDDYDDDDDDASSCTTCDKDDKLPEWIQHEDSTTGDFYYENTKTHSTTWMAPVGEAFVKWTELSDDNEIE